VPSRITCSLAGQSSGSFHFVHPSLDLPSAFHRFWRQKKKCCGGFTADWWTRWGGPWGVRELHWGDIGTCIDQGSNVVVFLCASAPDAATSGRIRAAGFRTARRVAGRLKLCFGLHAVADAAGFAQEQGGFEWHGGSSGFGTRSGIGQERLLVAGHEISDMNDTGCAPQLALAVRRHAVAHADLAFCSVPDVIWCVPLPEPTCLLLGLGQGRVAQRGRSAFAVVPASARDRSLCTTRRIACCRRMA